ncbi:shikimate kinase [Brevibacterium sp. 5221]|uniref:Shikimate kinase n=1 Tax=Brevibacterium rongguiense TaxID=2695267 RepID=A0A6N9H7K7_9MICO|nr:MULTISPECIES: shikimate kinase [Brevibacterium]MYM20058.1 shikimate kinase [Brevibacterium rongguiense]WAL40909.1 shikimate kinase [Brevibacterium sp. BRM-1]
MSSADSPVPRPAPPLKPVPAAESRIALVGPPAAGKSTIGRLLADRLGLRLVDTDAVVAAAHGPIPEIFAQRGEARFRELERAAVRRALSGLLERPGVVSLGGGAILNPGTRAQLRHPAIRVVNIHIDAATAAARLGGSKRPLLAGDADPVERWKSIADERAELYDAVATLTVPASSAPPATIVNRIVDVLTGLQRAEDYARFGAYRRDEAAAAAPHGDPGPGSAPGPGSEEERW